MNLKKNNFKFFENKLNFLLSLNPIFFKFIKTILILPKFKKIIFKFIKIYKKLILTL